MKKITNSTIKYWNKMWKAWKRNRLGSPLNELVTFCNYAANGFYNYFIQFKNKYVLKYNLFILKQHLPENHYSNLIKAKELYDSYSDKKALAKIEEEVFKQYDEIYFQDVGLIESIIFDKLYNGEVFSIPNVSFWINIRIKLLKIFKRKRNII